MSSLVDDITIATSSESLVKYQTAMEAISDSFFVTYEQENASLAAYKEKMRLKMLAKKNEKVAQPDSCLTYP
ncbi:hypothetical protein [Photobacterium damselae]|uniref:hypothetical protein n=1 Tax=Photobacterium damselae TaxID=38293 RepID=UPI00370CE1D7